MKTIPEHDGGLLGCPICGVKREIEIDECFSPDTQTALRVTCPGHFYAFASSASADASIDTLRSVIVRAWNSPIERAVALKRHGIH